MGELYTLCDVQYVLMYLISVLLYHHHLPSHPFHLLLHKLHHLQLLLLHNLHHLLYPDHATLHLHHQHPPVYHRHHHHLLL